MDEVEKESRRRSSHITWYDIGYDVLKNNLTDVKGTDIEDLKADAKEWWLSDGTRNSWYGKMLYQVLDHWSAKTLMLILKVFAERYFYDWINNIDRREDEEEDEEDD